MKRVITTLCLLFALSIVLTACSGGGGGDGTPAPAAPTGVTAQAGDGQVTVSWNAVSEATSYNIYWNNAAGVTTTDTKVVGAASPYVHTPCTNGTPYYYVVTAVNDSGESGLSAEVSATPQAPAPGVPANVAITAGNGQNTISWTAVTGASSYNIYWSNTPGVTTSSTKITNATSPYAHGPISNGVAYYYRVTAMNGGGESGLSSEVSAMPHMPAPGAPLNVKAVQGAQKITISWDPVSGATSYNIYWSNTADVTKANGTKIANVTSPYLHPHLSPGNYYYVVTAVDANGESTESLRASMPVNLITFVTSTTGNGNLGSWPDAVSVGKTGIAAGDAICQARALASGLTGTFKAWLSDSQDDAYCRITGFSGMKGSNCGQTALPVSAGPWVRTDGFPFGDTIDKIVDTNWYAPTTQKVYAPLVYDEFGTRLTSVRQVWTGTYIDGTAYSGLTCTNWTSAAAANYARGGLTDGTAQLWSVSGYPYCNYTTVSLDCFQTGAGPNLPNFRSAGKIAFVTSVSGTGNLGSWPDAAAAGKTGVAAGDAICQARAAAAGVANSAQFKALLSSGPTGTINAIDRFTSNGPWVRLDGVTVANSKAELIGGSLFSSIHQTEVGTYLGYGLYAWTGTKANGTIDGANTCNGWTDGTSGALGTRGAVALTDAGGWLNFSTNYPCNIVQYLYCLED